MDVILYYKLIFIASCIKGTILNYTNLQKMNAIANIIGRLWSAGLSVLALPFYVRYLGAEAYGLVGFFASLNVIFNFLDFGLSATVNREIAQYRALNRSKIDYGVVLRTFEVLYWPIGIAIGLVMALSSTWIAEDWIKIREISGYDLRIVIIIMSFAFTLQWPASLYSGVVLGMERQILHNTMSIFIVTLRTLGSLCIIMYISSSITYFFAWQGIMNLLEIVIKASVAWYNIGGNSWIVSSFNMKIIRSLWRFAIGYNTVGVLGLILSTGDRIIMSKSLPIEQLGYYSIASTMAGAMPLISNAISTALFPYFAARAKLKQYNEMAKYYHKGVQVIAFFSVGFAFVLAVFSQDILLLWTGSVNIAQYGAQVLILLAIANLINALANPSYTLLMASGYTKTPLIVNGINAVLFVPLMMVLIPKFGIIAAAYSWLAQNMICFMAYTLRSHQICIDDYGFLRSTYRDVFGYFVSAIASVVFIRLSLPWFSGIISLYIAPLLFIFTYCVVVIKMANTLRIFPFDMKSINMRK